MNETKLEGAGQNVCGNVKEAVGKATGDESFSGKGVADQVISNAKQMAAPRPRHSAIRVR